MNPMKTRSIALMLIVLSALASACTEELAPTEASTTADDAAADGKGDSFADTASESAETYFARFLYTPDGTMPGWYYNLGTWTKLPLPNQPGQFIDLAIYLTPDNRYVAEYAEVHETSDWTYEQTGVTAVQGRWYLASDTLVLEGLGTGSRAEYLGEGAVTPIPAVSFTLSNDLITPGVVGATGTLVRLHTTASLEATLAALGGTP